MRPTISRTAESTRDKILAAAFAEFYKNGFQGGSLNRIVDDARTTKGALFHHFKGKKHLGHAVLQEVIQPRLEERWFERLRESNDPISDLKQIFRQRFKQEISSGQLENGCPLNNLAQEMSPLDEGFRKRINDIYVGWRESIASAFVRGLKAGKVRKGVSPTSVAAFVVAAQTGIAGTAKNAQDGRLMMQAGEALFDYLDSLKP